MRLARGNVFAIISASRAKPDHGATKLVCCVRCDGKFVSRKSCRPVLCEEKVLALLSIREALKLDVGRRGASRNGPGRLYWCG